MNNIIPEFRRWDSGFFRTFLPTIAAFEGKRNAKKGAPTKAFTRYVISNVSDSALCSNATRVFRAEPTRLFLHGCLSHGVLIEVWVFTRTGVYRSGVLSFEELHFNQLMIIYEGISEGCLGANPLVYSDSSGQSSIFVQGREKLECCFARLPRAHKMILDQKPIFCPDQIISNRSICYRATDAQHNVVVVKFSHNTYELRREEKLLRRVTMRNIPGVAHLVDFQTLHWAKIQASCVVITPLARPISDYQSIPELLECFRDAIRSHYSLYKRGNILHRDISPGNIMISNSSNKADGERCGMLIDLGLSIDLEVKHTAPYDIAGTKMFMAIELLRSNKDAILPTYRHDLESFFYVFLYMAVCRNRTLPRSSRLMGWLKLGNQWAEMGRQKGFDLTSSGRFTAIVLEFAPEFSRKPLVKLAFMLRQILFYPDGIFFAGTRDGILMDHLYNSMISAFEDALSCLNSESLAPTG
ncbi:hypothetical protein ACHAPU_003182 [Fusarium lateritium]